jgi:cell division protein FtsB
MAVYQGARPQPAFLPRRASPRDVPAIPSLPRRRIRGAVRAQRNGSRTGLVLGAIVIAFLLAFFWLAQTVGVSATSYDIDQRAAERDRLEARVRDLQSDINRLGHEPAIRKQAIDAGFGQLGEPEVIPAR